MGKKKIQTILVVLLTSTTIVGIIIALIGAIEHGCGLPGGNVVMIVTGGLIVAISSFALTFVAKVLGKDD